MDGNKSNTFLAIALSILILVLWQVFYITPRVEAERRAAEIEAARESGAVETTVPNASSDGDDTPQAQTGQFVTPAPDPGTTNVPAQTQADAQVQAEASPRIPLENELIKGSVNMRGGRIDDLKLKGYRQTIDEDSAIITLLSPTNGGAGAYFAEFGFTPNQAAGELPGPNTMWQARGERLETDTPLVLEWTNDTGLTFERTIALDEQYMFTITDRVTNTGERAANLTSYGRIARFGQPETQGIFVLHEGLLGVFGEEGLDEIDYDDLEEARAIDEPRVSEGWLGITDKYWATALIPGDGFKGGFRYFNRGVAQYQADFLGAQTAVGAGETIQFQHRLFAGAKKTDIIDGYAEALGIANFDLMIDWGWFYFITKPLFFLLQWLNSILGNFGVAILMATVLIKAVFLPLANMSYASMAKMKKVQPELMAIRERFEDDKMKQQQEMMALYKKEKINPAAGCWPILIQIPVFFALYKVLFVTIEMRHAPFFGWIQDLSAPDPTSIFNLFGLLPWEPAGLLLVGIWPILMGITMFLQMQMNPQPPDPTQAMIFRWMPLVFTFMLATFPAGLVIYWTWNNFLSIVQQGIIMRRHGTKIELLDNLKGLFSKKPKETETTKGK